MLESFQRFGLMGAALVPVGALIFFMRRTWRRARLEARAEALRRGLTVTEVEREVALSRDRGRSWRLEPAHCVRYFLPHAGAPQLRWSLLLRPGTDDGTLAPHWTLSGSPASLPPALRDVLYRIASAGTEEYLEFEGDTDGVSAYWDEWGGATMAAQVHHRLQEISRAMEAVPFVPSPA
jgi:hypothetical protein